MTKDDFIKEYNSYFPQQKLAAVKLVKDISNLGLRESKELVDELWNNYNSNHGERIVELLERKHGFIFQINLKTKLDLNVEFTKLQLKAKEAGIEEYFQFLCESSIDETLKVNIQHIPTRENQNKRSDEVQH